ncbi:MAG: Rieske (2Fe-2S) protein [Candidatus Rokuibacteriota bacterium]
MIHVAAVADIRPGAGREVSAAGKTLALFNVDGAYYAVDSTCPHRGGPLAEGDLDGHVVGCPWHGWAWDVTSGASANNPAVRIGCYPVVVEEGQLFVRLVS